MEFVAALRGTFDDQKPSLFELLSEEQLNSLLPPTLRYLLNLTTQRYPRYLLRAFNSFDELYALLQLVVERHYLLTRGGTFTETFYGLKRERAIANEIPRASIGAEEIVNETLKLGRKDVYKNLVVAVLLPYLKRKLDEAHEVDAPRTLMGRRYADMPPNSNWKQRITHYFRWFLRNVYPSMNAAYYFSIMAFQLAYLFDNTKYHSPFMWLIGSRIRRMTRADHMAIEALSKKAVVAAGAQRPGHRSFLDPRRAGVSLLSSLSWVLPMSIFGLEFLEWWHSSGFAKQLSRKAAEAIELPVPIIADECVGKKAAGVLAEDDDANEPSPDDSPIAASSMLHIFTVRPLADSSLCPICKSHVVTPTACQTGVVYCYPCIHRWVEGVHPKQDAFMEGKNGTWESGEGRCAVTGRKVLGGTECLRRIMV